MDLKLTGKKALVTGTGSQIGFGRGVALFLAQEGCDVVCADIDLTGAKQTTADVQMIGRRSIAIKIDITNKTEVDVAWL